MNARTDFEHMVQVLLDNTCAAHVLRDERGNEYSVFYFDQHCSELAVIRRRYTWEIVFWESVDEGEAHRAVDEFAEKSGLSYRHMGGV